MAASKPDFDGLEKLGHKIYDRDFPAISNFAKPKLPDNANSAPKRWDDTEKLFADSTSTQGGRRFPLKAVFIGSIIFFLLCVAVAGVIIYRGLNTVSNSNVDLSFLGPVTIAAGTPLNFSVVIKNNNQISLQNTQLYLSFPNGTVEASHTSVPLLHESDVLGTVASGTSVTHDVQAVIYGAEHATEQITATIQYSLPNSNALYQKKEIYTIGISSAPLTMSVNAPNQTPPGAPVHFVLTLGANSSNPPANVLVTARYPFGFQFASSTPAPIYDNSEWLFPSISASSTRTIIITGYLQGQENDQETTQFLVGTQSQTDPKKLDVIYLAQNQTLTIQQSPIALNLAVGITSGQNIVVQPGISNGTLTITNNLPVDLLNAETTLTLNGNALDPTSVSAGQNGIYREPTQAITWDRLSDPGLGTLSPGQSVTLNFNFSTLPANVLANLANGAITLNANVTGQEFGAAPNAAPISSTSTVTARLVSAVNILAHAVYSTGPFSNTGPVPPRADMPTTYTILWTLTNSSNTVLGDTVTATLPPYVKWLNNINPSTAAVTFDTNSNTITWNPGTLPAGGAAPVASVAFQVEVDPTIDQIGSAAPIVNNISFSGTDGFVNVPVSASAGSLTTDISTDPTYGSQNGFVTQ